MSIASRPPSAAHRARSPRHFPSALWSDRASPADSSKTRRCAKEACQPQRSIGRHRPLAFNDRANARRRHAQCNCESVDRHFERFEELFAQHLAGMGRDPVRSRNSLVIIDAFDICRAFLSLRGADTPLVVDANQVPCPRVPREASRRPPPGFTAAAAPVITRHGPRTTAA